MDIADVTRCLWPPFGDAQDDILDEADTRRGEEAAHVRLGERAAALVGDFLRHGCSGGWLGAWLVEVGWVSLVKVGC